MTWTELIKKHQLDLKLFLPEEVPTPNRKQVREALSRLFAGIAEQAMHGKRVSIPGFGVFTLRQRKSRTVRNPATKELMALPSVRSVGFRCSKTITR